MSLPPPILGGLSSFLEQAGREESCDSLTQGLSVYSFEMVLEPVKVDLFYVCPFVIGLFHFRFVQVESCVRINFLGLNNIPLYVLAHSLDLLTDVWVISVACLP